MGWISKLKDTNYYIDFDSGCIYENDKVVAEITSPIQVNILLYFSEHPEMWLKKDGIITNCWPDAASADNVTDGTFYKQIHNVTHIHVKVGESIESRRSMGYKYHGARREKKGEEAVPASAAEEVRNTNEKKRKIVTRSVKDITVKKAALKINLYEIQQGRKPLDEGAELIISDIIDAIMENLYDDILSVSAQLWKDFDIEQKAQTILKAYIYELSSIRDLSMSDSNNKF